MDPNETSDGLMFSINPIFPNDEELLACEGGVADVATAIQAARDGYASLCVDGGIAQGTCVASYCADKCNQVCDPQCRASFCETECKNVCPDDYCRGDHCEPHCKGGFCNDHCGGHLWICWWSNCEPQCKGTYCNNECTSVCDASFCIDICEGDCGSVCPTHCLSVCTPQCRGHVEPPWGKALPFKGVEVIEYDYITEPQKQEIMDAFVASCIEINNLEDQGVDIDDEQFVKEHYYNIYKEAIAKFNEWAYAVMRAREYRASQQ